MEGVIIKEISLVLIAKGYGAINWCIQDDNNNIIEIQLERVLLLEDLVTRILLP